ncbi:MAG: hypothetical protein ABIG68_01465 [Acidobacteriota bacterium]
MIRVIGKNAGTGTLILNVCGMEGLAYIRVPGNEYSEEFDVPANNPQGITIPDLEAGQRRKLG